MAIEPMLSRSALLLLLLPTPALAQESSALGEWRDHFPYTNVITVAEGGGAIHASSATAAFRYGVGTGELERLNKTNVLSDVGVQGLAWNAARQALLVYYTNGNVDLLEGSTATNIGDIKRSSIIGNKGIYCAYMSGSLAYLGCGFGIVVLDLAAKEVRETWFIGPSGSQVRVNSIAMTADSIYAASTTGLYVAARNALNLASFDSWRRRTDMGPSLSPGPFNAVAVIGAHMLLNAQRNSGGDSLLVLAPDGTWSRFAPLFGKVNRGLSVSSDGQVVVVPHEQDLHVYDQQLQEVSYVSNFEGQQLAPQQAIMAPGGDLWVADREQGLLRIGQAGPLRVQPNGPRTASAWRMAAAAGNVYVATGAVTGTWANGYKQDGVFTYRNGTWRTVDRLSSPFMQGENEFTSGIADPVAVEIDPDDADDVFFGSWDEGILEFRDGEPAEVYNPTNSSLGYDINPFQDRLYVAGLDFDKEGNLWASNAWSEEPISVRQEDGTWRSFDPGSLLNGNLLLGDLLAAANGYKWIIRPRGNGILVYDSGNSLESTDDDQYRILNNQEGSGGLPAPDVYALLEDADGQVWVGTSRGIAVFYGPEAIFTSGDFDAEQILIEQDGNVQALLETEAINTLALDGANRKWIGTQGSGAYLVSPDGREELLHFTAENSPLPSNTIVNIAVDGSTGEVYFATDRGIMSYRGSAIEGAPESVCSTVFPNPVRESWTGPIVISGLVKDSEVKITDVSGNLVYRTTSLGGQAIWDGNDMGGRRAATGVYLVFASDATGTFKCNTKLLLVK